MTKDLTPYHDAIHREVIAPALEALKQRLLDGVVRGPVEDQDRVAKCPLPQSD